MSEDTKPPTDPSEDQKSDEKSDESGNTSDQTNVVTEVKPSPSEQKTPPTEEKKKSTPVKKKAPKDDKLEAKRKEKKEQLKKELDERKVKRNEELKRLSKCEGAKTITDEIQFERAGYEIKRNELVASGYFAKLYKASKKKEETEMCVKLIILDRIPKDYSENLTKNSLKILRFVGQSGEKKTPICIHFPKVFDIFMTSGKVFIYLEQFQTLSLQTRLRTKDTITEYDAKKWGKQLAEAVDCLQLAGIAHRNIRPENVIFDKKYDIKLVGFGYAVVFCNEETQQTITQTKHSPKPKEIHRFDHLPPQVLKEDYDASTVDVWSWAVFVCLCIHKQNPFDPKSEATVEEQWNQYSTKFQFSPESKQLLDKCFVSDATSRVTSFEILRHKWLTDKKKKKI